MMMLRPSVAKAGLPMQPPQQPSRASFAVQAPVLHQPAMQQAASRDPPPGTYRTKPCRHYEKGRCTWGASCRFLHATTRSAAAPPVTSVRIGTQPSASSDSTSTVPAQVAPDTPVMPPTNPSTPAASAASPNGTHRYSHNPYSSSPMAGATSSPLASAKPTPLHFGAAFDEPAPTLAPLPMPMERRFSRP